MFHHDLIIILLCSVFKKLVTVWTIQGVLKVKITEAKEKYKRKLE